jgi:hypothetical protein
MDMIECHRRYAELLVEIGRQIARELPPGAERGVQLPLDAGFQLSPRVQSRMGRNTGREGADEIGQPEITIAAMAPHTDLLQFESFFTG